MLYGHLISRLLHTKKVAMTTGLPRAPQPLAAHERDLGGVTKG
jgi:hypothetical protein